MYEIYVKLWRKWKLVERAENIEQVNISIKYIYENYKGLQIQVIRDGKYLTGLDGTDYGYFYFYNKYVLKRDINFDYIKEYEKEKKFRKFN